ncbi:MAG: AMP-binding protein [bacterium]|nr:AMP-binding protein [bacterium]
MIAARTDAETLRAAFERVRRDPRFADLYAGITDLADAPAIGKDVVLERLRSFEPRAEPRGVYLVRSGGSTREPLIFPVDIAENHAQRQALAEQLRRVGIFGPSTVALNVFGYSDLYRTAAIFDDLLERCDATTLPMSAHAPYADMLAAARRFAPTHLLGTPSKLTLFARFLADRDERLDIAHLLYGGEPLRETTLRLLRERFGVRRVWSLYGGAETGIWAWCDANRNPGCFELLSGIVVEVLDPDAQGFGPLAVTNGYRARFPLFRYRVGDVGRIIERDGVRLLELRGRDRSSFQFAETTYDLGRIEEIALGSDAVQLHLRFDEHGRDTLRLLLVDDSGAVSLAAVERELRALLDCPEFDGIASVERVERRALHHDPVTAKAPAIVDHRR